MSLCQLPLGSRQLHHYMPSSSSAGTAHDDQPDTSSLSSSQQKQPSIAKLKVRVEPVNMTVTGQWRPVTCVEGHVTHVLLACDTSAACLTRGDVTFSRHSDTWGCPKSCPLPLAGPPPPPSFPCRSEGRHVSYSLVCDHRRDCLDGSDEVFCHFPSCSDHSHFQCYNKQVCHILLCCCLWFDRSCRTNSPFHPVTVY